MGRGIASSGRFLSSSGRASKALRAKAPVRVGPLRARRTHVLVQEDEAAGLHGRADLVEDALDVADVVQGPVEEHDVVARRGQSDRVDVLDPVGEPPGEAFLLGRPLRLRDRLGREVDPFDPVADALEEDVALEKTRAAADRETQRQGRRGVLLGEPLHRPPVGVARDPPVDRAPDEGLRAPVAVFGLARGPGVPESRAAAASARAARTRAPAPGEGGERVADGGRQSGDLECSRSGSYGTRGGDGRDCDMPAAIRRLPSSTSGLPPSSGSGKFRRSSDAQPGGSFSIRDEGRDENALAGFRPVAPRETGIEETQARSSGGEHYLDTVGVSGSNPLEPTNSSKRRRLAQLGERFLHTEEVNGSIPLAPTKRSRRRGVPAFFLFRSAERSEGTWKPWRTR